jgi:hypothetical protein
MKLTIPIIAALLAVNAITGTLLWERTIALQKWEDVSAGLNLESVRTAVEDMRFNEGMEAIRELQDDRKKVPIVTKECRSSLETLRKSIIGGLCR